MISAVMVSARRMSATPASSARAVFRAAANAESCVVSVVVTWVVPRVAEFWSAEFRGCIAAESASGPRVAPDDRYSDAAVGDGVLEVEGRSDGQPQRGRDRLRYRSRNGAVRLRGAGPLPGQQLRGAAQGAEAGQERLVLIGWPRARD